MKIFGMNKEMQKLFKLKLLSDLMTNDVCMKSEECNLKMNWKRN